MKSLDDLIKELHSDDPNVPELHYLKQYQELLKQKEKEEQVVKLQCLENDEVDNWTGRDVSLEEYYDLIQKICDEHDKF